MTSRSIFFLAVVLAVVLFGSFVAANTNKTERVFNPRDFPRLFSEEKIQAGGPFTLYGVNLGCWLVLEGWCVPSVYKSVNDGRVQDEWTLGQYQGNQPGSNGYNAASNHWNNFITQDDINKMAQSGITHVRIPVGYWMFYSRAELDSAGEPYITGGQQPALTKVLGWLKQVGVKALIDLHGAPGSQNGAEHSGRSGQTLFTSGNTVSRALDAVQRICDYIKQLEGNGATSGVVFGIELLNEPNPWNLPAGLDGLKNYYLAGYPVVRNALGNDYTVVIQDGYDFFAWNQFMAGYQNVLIDTHMYQCFDQASIDLTSTGHMITTCSRDIDRIKSDSLWVMTGEWALTTGVNEGDTFYNAWALAQMHVYETASSGSVGWFYWTLKAEYPGTWNYLTSLGSTLPSKVPAADSSACNWECFDQCCGPMSTASDSDVQNAINWICGQNQGICDLFGQNGYFYNPNQLRLHANIAFTQYWQTIAQPSGQSPQDGCNFGGIGYYCGSNCNWVNK